MIFTRCACKPEANEGKHSLKETWGRGNMEKMKKGRAKQSELRNKGKGRENGNVRETQGRDLKSSGKTFDHC